MMQLIRKNLWGCGGVLCLTTNGYVKQNGDAVMGAGVALQALERIPGIARSLGDGIKRHGNVVFRIAGPDLDRCTFGRDVLSFPVKHHWRYKADVELIERSARQLAKLVEFHVPADSDVFLPKPGCGNGGLTYSDVEGILDQHLGHLDNLYVVDR